MTNDDVVIMTCDDVVIMVSNIFQEVNVLCIVIVALEMFTCLWEMWTTVHIVTRTAVLVWTGNVSQCNRTWLPHNLHHLVIYDLWILRII